MNAATASGNSLTETKRETMTQKLLLLAAVVALAVINAWALGLFTIS